MNRTVTVTTPENIVVTYELAGVATRSLALLIDLLIQVIVILLLMLVMSLLERIGHGIDHVATFVEFIAVFCIIFVYNIFFEMVWGGRTPGKRLFGLRVIREGGYPITIVASCIRNILRFADFGIIPMPVGGGGVVLCGAPGLISVFLSPSYRRIGDYAAGTIVIHELTASPFAKSLNAGVSNPAVDQILPFVKNVDRMTVQDFRIVRRFTTRRPTLDPIVQAAVAESIARPLLIKLEMRPDIHFQTEYADILEAIERRYTEENGIL